MTLSGVPLICVRNKGDFRDKQPMTTRSLCASLIHCACALAGSEGEGFRLSSRIPYRRGLCSILTSFSDTDFTSEKDG